MRVWQCLGVEEGDVTHVVVLEGSEALRGKDTGQAFLYIVRERQ